MQSFKERLEARKTAKDSLLLSFRFSDSEATLSCCERLERLGINLSEEETDYLFHFIANSDCTSLNDFIIASHLINLKAKITDHSKNLFLQKFQKNLNLITSNDYTNHIANMLFRKGG